MIRRRTILIFFVAASILIASMTGIYFILWNDNQIVKGEPLAIDTNATVESVASLSDDINSFSCDLFGNLCNDESKNHFFSPYSIFVALSMTYEGAEGQTAEELYNLLHFSQHDDTTLCSFGRIYNLLNQKKEYTLNTANALWIKEDYPFLPEYLNFIEHYYMGKATEVDFSDRDATSELINEWVSEKTNSKITDLVTPDSIDPLTALILTNAIYFKGTWVHEFDPEKTVDSEFRVSPVESVTVPMMTTDSDISCNYTETDTVQIIELPYKEEKVSLIIMLPKENNISLAEELVTPNMIPSILQEFHEESVRVSIPKFTFKTEYSLKETLSAMGLNISFTPAADFSGMTGQKDLSIDKVIHKAFIEVNEEGTEAAAATSVHMVLTSVPQTTQFIADHPFAFILYHKETGTILFMGEVNDPSK
jgi:serpin B